VPCTRPSAGGMDGAERAHAAADVSNGSEHMHCPSAGAVMPPRCHHHHRLTSARWDFSLFPRAEHRAMKCGDLSSDLLTNSNRVLLMTIISRASQTASRSAQPFTGLMVVISLTGTRTDHATTVTIGRMLCYPWQCCLMPNSHRPPDTTKQCCLCLELSEIQFTPPKPTRQTRQFYRAWRGGVN